MNPGGFGTGASEEGSHGIDENRKYSLSSKSAGLAQGEDSFRKTSAVLADGAKAGFSPQHSKAQEAFGVIVRRGNTGFLEKQPQMIHFVDEATGQFAGVVSPVAVCGYQANETRIEHVPFADGGRRFGHVAQPLQFLVGPGATFGDLGVFSLRKPFGVADQMRQTGLTQPHPFRVNGVAVADQNALPILDQCLESLLRPMPVNHEISRQAIPHDPQPLQRSLAIPSCFVHVIDGRTSDTRADGLVMRGDGAGNPVEDFLDGALADMQAQHRKEKVLGGSSRVGLGADHDGNNGGESRAVARAVLRGDERLEQFAAVAAPTSMQDEVCHFQLDLRQFNDLVDVVRLHVREAVAAAATLAGIEFRDLGWTESLLSEPLALFSVFSIGVLRSLALGERIIAGGWLVGIRGVGAEFGFEHLDAFPESLNFTVQNMHVPQHRPRGVHHHFGGKTGSYGHCYPHVPTMCIN